MTRTVHISVMPEETLALLDVRPGGRYIDGTFGGGGHAGMILARGGNVLGIDRDEDALARGRERFKDDIAANRLHLTHGNHEELQRVAELGQCHDIDGILLDLGVSSDQIDTPERGFSFMQDGPLDMRMDRSAKTSAAELIATASVEELTTIFRELGEEPQAAKYARAIMRARESSPVITTAQLAAVIEAAAGGRRGMPRHPATRVFQALRMAVNREMKALEGALEAGLKLLAPNGRMVVITFESLTDRCVKQTFVRHAGKHVSLQQGGSTWEGELPAVERLTRHAATPSEAECRANPRARSAKLRAVRRLTARETHLLTGQGVES